MDLKNRDLASASVVVLSGAFNILFRLSSSDGGLSVIVRIMIMLPPEVFKCSTSRSYLPSSITGSSTVLTKAVKRIVKLRERLYSFTCFFNSVD